MKTWRAIGLSVLGTVFILAAFGPAIAEPIVFDFSGTITGILDEHGYLPAEVVIGQPYLGRLVYDLSAADWPASAAGFYPHVPPLGPYGLSLATGGVTFSSNPDLPFEVSVLNDLLLGDPPKLDAIQAVASPIAPGYVDPSTYTSGFFRFNLTDSSGTAFDSEMPPRMLRREEFTAALVEVYFATGEFGDAATFSFAGNVTEISQVPEPSTLLTSLIATFSALVFWRQVARKRAAL